MADNVIDISDRLSGHSTDERSETENMLTLIEFMESDLND